tara:strand:- start:197 stop:397 length:201 start_codon:yes stop_codon:yes gene_type:complete
MTDTVLGLLTKEFQELRDNRGSQLGSGAAKNYPHYTESVGYIRALNEVIVRIKELERNHEFGDDDD